MQDFFVQQVLDQLLAFGEVGLHPLEEHRHHFEQPQANLQTRLFDVVQSERHLVDADPRHVLQLRNQQTNRQTVQSRRQVLLFAQLLHEAPDFFDQRHHRLPLRPEQVRRVLVHASKHVADLLEVLHRPARFAFVAQLVTKL